MASRGPMADFLDENDNVIPSLAALLKHAAISNERNFERAGVPQMPLSIREYDSGKYGILFGPVGFGEQGFSEAWSSINDLAVAWAIGYEMGRAS